MLISDMLVLSVLYLLPVLYTVHLSDHLKAAIYNAAGSLVAMYLLTRRGYKLYPRCSFNDSVNKGLVHGWGGGGCSVTVRRKPRQEIT
jgi:hypothetical protein